MAVKITDLTNTSGATATYPYGQLQDDSGGGTGTPIDVLMMNDVMQFFQKLMDEASVTPNSLPENATNGFQLMEAFKNASKPYYLIQGILTDSGFTELFNDSGETVTFNYVNVGVYDLDITGSGYTSGKTSVLTSNQNTAQGATTLIVTGGDVISTSKVKISCMAFLNMSSGGATAAGVNIGGGLHPNPVYVEIKINK